MPPNTMGKALKKRYRMPSMRDVHRLSSTAIGCVSRMTAKIPKIEGRQ
jgi:hypothetical protein